MTVGLAPTSHPGSLLSAVGSLVLGLAILALLLFRQMKVRGVRANPLLPTVLAVVGLIELDGYAQVHPFTSLQGTFLAVSLLVFAVAHETVETGAATTRSAETRPQSEKPRLEIKISEPRE